MEKCLNTWLNYSLDNVISVWGYPTPENTIAGKHLYVWDIRKSVYIPQSTYGNAYTNGWVNPNNNTLDIEKRQKRLKRIQKKMNKQTNNSLQSNEDFKRLLNNDNTKLKFDYEKGFVQE